LGEGIPFHRAAIPADPRIKVTAEDLWRARASVVARLGAAMAERGQFTDAPKLAPVYIRRPEAEEKWDHRGGPGQ
jgi:tRNA A37 threonylcarbamoyladenosine modification protein TsaB